MESAMTSMTASENTTPAASATALEQSTNVDAHLFSSMHVTASGIN
jgi:hypothetical protein